MYYINNIDSYVIIYWISGKDSCLALWRAQQESSVTGLLSVLDETGLRARSHGVSKELLCSQAQSLGLESYFVSASWKSYEERLTAALRKIAEEGVSQVVFGDIDLMPHREWEEKVCARAGLAARLPLWNEDRLSLVNQFLELGFKARIVCVDGRFLDSSFVGREFDRKYIESLPPSVDPCGENGEYHTFVYDGPNFNSPVPWKSLGKHEYVSPPEYGSRTYHFDLLGT